MPRSKSTATAGKVAPMPCRNIIRYCWNTGHGNRAGMITGFVKDLIVEENLYDHNGWLPPAWGVNDADPDDQSHALYLAPLPEESGPRTGFEATVRGNIFARSGSHGIKGGPGGVLEDNLFVGNAIAGYMSRSDSTIPAQRNAATSAPAAASFLTGT